mmetsp:Transcript_139790/g.243365  ORF Transcript_139790/g.243365 Transcript_139790/m.243365 type:complete len:131 (+) Transcript_139790:1782-2174(+)
MRCLCNLGGEQVQVHSCPASVTPWETRHSVGAPRPQTVPPYVPNYPQYSNLKLRGLSLHPSLLPSPAHHLTDHNTAEQGHGHPLGDDRPGSPWEGPGPQTPTGASRSAWTCWAQVRRPSMRALTPAFGTP